MPLMRIRYYIYAEDEKSWFRWEGLLSALAGSMYPHLTENSEIFFEVGSDRCFISRIRRTTSLIWNDRRGSQLREELKPETFITRFYFPTNEVKSRI